MPAAERHISYCRNCCAQCGIEVVKENGVLTSMKGDKNNPFSRGYFCVKGLSSIDMHNGEDRQDQCLKKIGNDFAAIDKNVALDEIAGKLGAIINAHGPEAVAVYTGTGVNSNSLSNSAVKAWLEAIGTPYLYTSMTLDQPAKWVTACRMGVFATGKYSTLDADVILLTGGNPAVSHASMSGPMCNPMYWAKQAHKRGMKLIVVDPAATQSARQADIHIKITPGEVAAFFAGLIKIVIDEGWYDDAFCDRFVDGFDRLKEAVSDFTPSVVEGRCGVSADTLHEVARIFATARRKSAHTGTGLNMGPDSNTSEHLSEALNAICGGYRKRGDMMRNMGALFDSGLAQEMVLPPNRSWTRGPKCHATDIGPIFGEYPTALLPKEIKHGGEKRIRALIVVGGNLVTALSDPTTVLPALSHLDLLVTLDQRETATGALSDYQIGISLPYERLDFNAILEYTRYMSFGQIAKPFMPRPDGVMEDWEFFTGLAGRMGYTMKFKRTLFSVSQAETPGPTYDVGPGEAVSAEDLIRFMVAQGRFAYDDLLANPHGIALPDVETEIAPAALDATARLELCPDDVLAEIKALPRGAYEAGPYPYRLVSRRLLETVNSAYTQSSKARRRYPENPVFMNPDDMEALGLNAKDKVLIESAHGRSRGTVKPEKGLKPGVLAASHGWGRPDKPEAEQGDLFTGRLVSITEDITTINYMPRQSAIPVRVKPLFADAS